MSTPPPTHLYIVIPAYNEERAIRQLLPDLQKTLQPLNIPFSLGVVNDGSTDQTVEVLRSLAQTLPIHPLRHETNRGYGAAIKTGVLWAIQSGQPNDIVVTLDCDNTHPPRYIPVMIQHLQEGFDVITATYRGPGAEATGVPVYRKILSQSANLLFRLRFGIPRLTTYTNGYRAYRLTALQQAYRHYGDQMMIETNFAGGTELFLKTLRLGARPGEVPFVLEYGKRGGASKIRITRTILGYLRLLFR